MLVNVKPRYLNAPYVQGRARRPLISAKKIYPGHSIGRVTADMSGSLYIITRLNVSTNTTEICEHFHDDLNAIKYLNEIPNSVAAELKKDFTAVYVQQMNPARFEIYARHDGWIYSDKRLISVIQMIVVSDKRGDESGDE
jgi:hypothetical protein